jgi:1,4-alpha-glucan branching enzyme
MSIHKTNMIKKGVCRVIFNLEEPVIGRATKVAVVGDFNNWDPEKNLMKKSKNGQFKCTIDFPLGKDYQFRYLIDNYTWDSEWHADKLVSTPYEETYNSLIECNFGNNLLNS